MPATVRCLSHASAHVRTLSVSVLRAILNVGCIKVKQSGEQVNIGSSRHVAYMSGDVIDWEADLAKCLTWEAHSRMATGMPIEYLETASKELGCPIFV